MQVKDLQLKRALRIALLILLMNVVGMGKMYAQGFTVGDLWYQVNNDGISVTVTGHVNGQSATGSLVIPETVENNGSTYSVTTIGDLAFFVCRGFNGNLTIPNSVTTIGNSVFQGCSGFTGSLTIPNSVTTIGNGAFSLCSGFTELMMFRTDPPTLGFSAFDESDFPIYVLYESLNDYKTTTNWSDYEHRIFPMVCKTIPAHGGSEGWAFIASPLLPNTNPTEIDDMITETETNFELYRFNQNAELEWENWKSHANNDDHYHFNLTNGQGYLYANAEDVNLVFKGEFNEDETKEVELACDANAEFAGWNLVGNPFPVSAYADRSYYVMNEDGTAIEPVAV